MTGDPSRRSSDGPPVLETARLVLTGHTPGMFEALRTMWSDPDVVKYIGGKPSSPRESWMRMLSYRGLWPVLGYGYWAICEKGTGRYVGDLGFADFHRDIAPSIRDVPEAGWALCPHAQGKGYATEALAVALGWLDGEVPCDRSACLISPDNLVSIRIAERAGYGSPTPISLNDRQTLLFSRMRRSGP